jgi:hypothetical protein
MQNMCHKGIIYALCFQNNDHFVNYLVIHLNRNKFLLVTKKFKNKDPVFRTLTTEQCWALENAAILVAHVGSMSEISSSHTLAEHHIKLLASK